MNKKNRCRLPSTEFPQHHVSNNDEVKYSGHLVLNDLLDMALLRKSIVWLADSTFFLRIRPFRNCFFVRILYFLGRCPGIYSLCWISHSQMCDFIFKTRTHCVRNGIQTLNKNETYKGYKHKHTQKHTHTHTHTYKTTLWVIRRFGVGGAETQQSQIQKHHTHQNTQTSKWTNKQTNK